MGMDDSPIAVLAFDVGGTTIKAEVLTEELRPLAATSVRTPRGAALVEALAATGQSLLDRLAPGTQVRAAGLALPGIIDAVNGVGVYAANVGLRDTPVAAPLTRSLGIPVHVGHDVVSAAEAERRHGAAADADDPVVVIIGTGIAAVSYVHGRRVAGSGGQAGEIGHLVVRPGGAACACGNRGCLEAEASAAAVAAAYRPASGHDVAGAHEVGARLGADPVADRVWQSATAALADGLLAAVAVLAPGAIVIGGGLAGAGDALLEPVGARLAGASGALRIPPLRTAALGSRAGVVGAGLLALDAVRGTDGSGAPATTAAAAAPETPRAEP